MRWSMIKRRDGRLESSRSRPHKQRVFPLCKWKDGLVRKHAFKALTASRLRKLAEAKKVPANQKAILWPSRRFSTRQRRTEPRSTQACVRCTNSNRTFQDCVGIWPQSKRCSDDAAEQLVNQIMASEAKVQQHRALIRTKRKAADTARRQAGTRLKRLGSGR